ncbi:response regulator transcription factor [Burkholderia pyrrocinia]|uniref:response regulator transcription factor n=1 Tax=Burkholderia pyrrocinia TaxID=60550 RepID=UPI00158A93F6|nr:response regulator transcription factor [Burkholderia pyrrocinia]
MSMKLAVVEDDLIFSSIVKGKLDEEGYDCSVFSTGHEFCRKFDDSKMDLVILDWALPDVSGMELLGWIRKNRKSDVPVIFVSNRILEVDVVSALREGADDYLAKPVRQAELVARVECALRKRNSGISSRRQVSLGQYYVDFDGRFVCVNGNKVQLTDREFAVAEHLFRNIGGIVTRKAMSQMIWGKELDAMSRTLDSHISRVRTKLGLHPSNGMRLTPIYGQGYRLDCVVGARDAL